MPELLSVASLVLKDSHSCEEMLIRNANGLHYPVGFPHDLYTSSNEAAACDQGLGSWIIDATAG